MKDVLFDKWNFKIIFLRIWLIKQAYYSALEIYL